MARSKEKPSMCVYSSSIRRPGISKGFNIRKEASAAVRHARNRHSQHESQGPGRQATERRRKGPKWSLTASPADQSAQKDR
jgi:hypothetical protein